MVCLLAVDDDTTVIEAYASARAEQASLNMDGVSATLTQNPLFQPLASIIKDVCKF